MAGDDVTIKIGADTSEAQAGIEAVSKSSAGLGDSLKTAGLVAAGAFAAISAAIGVSVASYKEAEKVQAQLSATLLSTNFAAGLTSKEILGLATELQKVSIFSDEAIASSSNLLLTFDRVGKETFPRAQKAILDLASGLKIDLQGATQQLGKALNDPIEGLAALSRVGIRFTDTQRQLIQGFIAVGDAAGAQNVILEEVEKRFGGQAQAATEGLGAIEQLKNSFDDFLELIGAEFAPQITDMANRLKTLIETLSDNQSLLGAIKNIASAIGTLISWIGQLLPHLDSWVNTTAAAGNAVLTFFAEFTVRITPLAEAIANIIAGIFTLDIDQIKAGLNTDFEGIFSTFRNSGKRALEEYAAGKSAGIAANQAANARTKAEEAKHQKEIEGIGKASNERIIADQAAKSAAEAELQSGRNDTLISGENEYANEILAIDRELADGQVRTYDEATDEILESASRRRSGAGGSGGEGGGQKLSPLIAPGVKSSGGNVLFDDSEEGQRARRSIGPNTYNPFTGRNDLKEFLVEAFRKSGVKFAEGYSGVGGENFAARFNGREIVIPENFAEGIRKGRFALTGADAGGRGGGSANVQISFQGREAARVLTARQTADRRLGTYRSRS